MVSVWGRDTDSTFRDATSRDVSGESSVALVSLGSAMRVTAALRGFFLVDVVSSAKTPAAAGVGVNGGSAAGVDDLACVFFLGGVEGSMVAAAVVVLRFLDGSGAGFAGGSCLCAWAPMRADRLVAAMFDVCAVVKAACVMRALKGLVNERSDVNQR